MINKILAEIKEEIKPDVDEEEKIEKMERKLVAATEKYGEKYDFEPRFCGSIAKNTWGENKKDIDFFLLFNTDLSEDELEEIGLEIGKGIIEDLGGDWDIAYAEHPYIQGEVGDFKVDIVPAYDTESDNIISSVDRTPWHVKWVNKNLSEDECDEVRLLKRFCKEHNLYGSSLKIRGFSGYLCELLIGKYRSFAELVKDIDRWEAGFIIDLEDYYEDDAKVKDKFDKEPLIVVDPVDKNRNVASVLSSENFFLFKKKILKFASNPSKNTFYGKKIEPLPAQEIMIKRWERGTDFLLIEFDAPDVHEDVLFPQMRKMNNRLQNLLEEEGFDILRKDCWSDASTCVIIIEFEVCKLPNIDKRVGPSIFDTENSKRFRNRYGEDHNTLIEDNMWIVEYWREYTEAVNYLKDFFEADQEELVSKGIPKHLAKQIDKRLDLASGDDAFVIFDRNEGLRTKMREYFDKDLD